MPEIKVVGFASNLVLQIFQDFELQSYFRADFCALLEPHPNLVN